ncbi:Sulfhydryl oxidase [Aphelenchoides besseyi]|nr:Sulfhydryl oxidase [Aphelenchoides besseyi]
MLELRWTMGGGFVFVFCLLFVHQTAAEVADFGRKPIGDNPSLYDATSDPIIQLDETTFNDTVFCGEHDGCTGFLVEFYSDWCGHCRAFAPLYKSISRDVRSWGDVVRVAAMNCADPANENSCQANGVHYYPFIKYFPRNSTSVNDGIKLKSYYTVGKMRDQLTQAILTDFQVTHYEDWPNFDPLPSITTYSEMWNGIDNHVQYIAIVFEEDQKSLLGSQLLLDLSPYKDRMAARRCLKGHALVDALQIVDYPTVAVFRRGEQEPILQSELRRLLLSELENHLRSEGDLNDLRFSSQKNATENMEPPKANVTEILEDCEENPEKCKQQFYVSELDMLKSIRYALFREVSRNGGELAGENLTNLHNFMDVLAHHFPYSSVDLAENGTENFLNASSRAHVVFTHMRDFIAQHGKDNPLSIDSWKSEFERAEEDQGHPFPINQDWQHCRGSLGQFRGYTCGLWMGFHALTVRSFRNSVDDSNFKPADVLYAIKGWVSSFFGCSHCRRHFLKMTTKTIKIEDHVHKPEDVFLYLWRAHNVVNARLKGKNSEDPKFPKLQFPPEFLCKDCHVGGDQERNDAAVEDFLLRHYSNIRPFEDLTEQQLSSN